MTWWVSSPGGEARRLLGNNSIVGEVDLQIRGYLANERRILNLSRVLFRNVSVQDRARD